MKDQDSLQKESREKEMAESLAAIATELREIKAYLKDIAAAIREKS